MRSARATRDFQSPPRLHRFLTRLLLLVVTAYFLLPLWWLTVSVTKTPGDLYGTFGWWFGDDFRLFGNLRDLFAYDDGIFGRWLLNSLIYAGGGGAISTLLAAMAGYAFAKLRFAGSRASEALVLAGVLIPAPALALPLYLMMSKVGLVNTYWSVLIPSAVSPIGLYLSKAYIADAVPDELLEAGRLDGASETRIFFTIVMRLIAPALVTIFLFQFVTISNNFFLPLTMLANDNLYPATLGLFGLNEQSTPIFVPLVITGSFVSVVPVIVVFVALQRSFRPELAAGAVKA